MFCYERLNVKKILFKLVILLVSMSIPFFPSETVYGAKQEADKKEEKFNVVLITVNVLRADHVSSYGYSRNTTPAFDELAKESYFFKNAFAQTGYTFPNMMSILTSIYPDSHKVYFAFKDKLPPKIKTLPELFKIFGYKTAWFAVLNEPHLALDAGYGRGFDSTINVDIQLNGKEEIANWISDNRDKPFFIAMNMRHTHGPYFPLKDYRNAFKSGKKGTLIENFRELEEKVYNVIVETIDQPDSIASKMYDKKTIEKHKKIFTGSFKPEKFVKLEELVLPGQRHRLGHLMMKTYNDSVNKLDKANMDYFVSLYDACILGTDQEIIKRTINTLKRKMIFDKTLIIITGDHGESHGEHGIIGHGVTYYDEMIHVPLIIKIPHESQYKEITGVAQSIDIMPTILDVVGMEKPYNIHGRSLLQLMNEKKKREKRKYVYGQNYEYAYMRSLDWKFIAKREDLGKEFGKHDMLFNLKDDPEENHNVIQQYLKLYYDFRENLKNQVASLPDYTDQDYEFSPNIDEETRERIKKTGYW